MAKATDVAVLKKQLEDLTAQQAKIQEVLQSKQEEEKTNLAQQIRDQIADQGFNLDEMTDLINPFRAKTKTSGSRKSTKWYVHKDDNTKTYIRGPAPVWMREDMESKGLDPNDKEARDKYKEDFLRVENVSTGEQEEAQTLQ